jgi:hypothetical protein
MPGAMPVPPGMPCSTVQPVTRCALGDFAAGLTGTTWTVGPHPCDNTSGTAVAIELR